MPKKAIKPPVKVKKAEVLGEANVPTPKPAKSGHKHNAHGAK